MQKIVNERGTDILKDFRFISYLNFENAFENPEEYDILWDVYKMGFMEDVFFIAQSSTDDKEKKLHEIEAKYLKKRRKANKKCVHNIFLSLVYSLNLDETLYSSYKTQKTQSNSLNRNSQSYNIHTINYFPSSMLQTKSIESGMPNQDEDLHTRLKIIVDEFGKDIICNARLLNILSDYKAFGSRPSLKFIIRTIINEGYSKRLLSETEWGLGCQHLVNMFCNETGIREDEAYLAFISLAYGIGISNSICFNPIQSDSITIIADNWRNLTKKQKNDYLQSIVEWDFDLKLYGVEIEGFSVKMSDYSRESLDCKYIIRGSLNKDLKINVNFFNNEGGLISFQNVANYKVKTFKGYKVESTYLYFECHAKQLKKIQFVDK